MSQEELAKNLLAVAVLQAKTRTNLTDDDIQRIVKAVLKIMARQEAA